MVEEDQGGSGNKNTLTWNEQGQWLRPPSYIQQHPTARPPGRRGCMRLECLASPPLKKASDGRKLGKRYPVSATVKFDVTWEVLLFSVTEWGNGNLEYATGGCPCRRHQLLACKGPSIGGLWIRVLCSYVPQININYFQSNLLLNRFAWRQKNRNMYLTVSSFMLAAWKARFVITNKSISFSLSFKWQDTWHRWNWHRLDVNSPTLTYPKGDQHDTFVTKKNWNSMIW